MTAESLAPGAQDSLIAALARCQAKFPPIVKAHENAGYKGSKYADVSDVLAVVRPVLAAEGLAVTQSTRVGDMGAVTLVTTLTCAFDEFEMTSEFPLHVSGLTDQQVGSKLTYNRRYQLCALLGVHPVGDDDDGNLAATAPRRTDVNVAAFDERPTYVGTSESVAMAAANPPEKPLAAMTAGEMARYGESIGVRVTGSKADILRQLESIVQASTGEEPFEVLATASELGQRIAPEQPDSEPVVAVDASLGSATHRKQDNAIKRAT